MLEQSRTQALSKTNPLGGQSHVLPRDEDEANREKSSSGQSVGTQNTLVVNREALLQLQAAVVGEVGGHHDRHTLCYRLPIIFWRIFASKCPWLMAMRFSLFLPTSMSILLLMAETFTDMFAAALFFQSSGGALDKTSSEGCQPSDVWEAFGKMLAVGLTTTYVAMVPQFILSVFHTREFVSSSAGDKVGRARRLWIWRVQDRLAWCLGSLYIAFCMLFTLLFLANVTEQDGMRWMITSVIAILQSSILIPLLTTFVLWVGTVITLYHKGVRRVAYQELVEAHRAREPDLESASDPVQLVAQGVPSQDTAGRVKGESVSDSFAIAGTLGKAAGFITDGQVPGWDQVLGTATASIRDMQIPDWNQAWETATTSASSIVDSAAASIRDLQMTDWSQKLDAGTNSFSSIASLESCMSGGDSPREMHVPVAASSASGKKRGVVEILTSEYALDVEGCWGTCVSKADSTRSTFDL